MTTLFELCADQENKDALREAHKCGDKRKMSEILHDLGFPDHHVLYSDTRQIFIAPLSSKEQTYNKYKRVYHTVVWADGTTYTVSKPQISVK